MVWPSTETETIMRTLLTILAIAMAAAPALAQPKPGDILGAGRAAFTASLKAQGYGVTAVRVDGDDLEIEAASSRQRLEIHADARSGKVKRVEAERPRARTAERASARSPGR